MKNIKKLMASTSSDFRSACSVDGACSLDMMRLTVRFSFPLFGEDAANVLAAIYYQMAEIWLDDNIAVHAGVLLDSGIGPLGGTGPRYIEALRELTLYGGLADRSTAGEDGVFHDFRLDGRKTIGSVLAGNVPKTALMLFEVMNRAVLPYPSVFEYVFGQSGNRRKDFISFFDGMPFIQPEEL